MGLLSRFKSLEGFSQRPLQEKNGNISSEGIQSTNRMEIINTHSSSSSSSYNNPTSLQHNKQIHQGRRASETSRFTSSSNTQKQTARPSTALPTSSTDPSMNHHQHHHHSRKRSITNPHTQTQYVQSQTNKIKSGLPIPFERARNEKTFDELNMPKINSRQSSRSSLYIQNDQRKSSNGSIQSSNITTGTADLSPTKIEAEVVEKGSFPVQESLVTSSLRTKEFDSSKLFTKSWHSPNPSPSLRSESSNFNSVIAMSYDDEGEAEEIVDEDGQSNDTIYAQLDRKVENRSLDSTSFYSAGIDASSQTSFRRGSLGTTTLRKAGSRFMNGFKQSSKRPSTADASITSRQSNNLDPTWRKDFHGDSHATSVKEINPASSFRLAVPRKSTDSLNSMISIGSRGTMTRSTTVVPSQAATKEKSDSRPSSPVHEFNQDEKSRPTTLQTRSRTPSFSSSHGLKAAIRASLSRPTSRSGPQVSHESQEVRSSPLLSPKNQDIDFIPYIAPSHSPAITSAPLPSSGSQQQKYNQSKQKLLPDQVSAFKKGQNTSIFKNAGLEKVSLSPAPRKRSKSRTSRSSNEVERLLQQKAEPVPQIPSQYRGERRSSIAATSFHSITEDHSNLSNRSSEDFCDSIDHKSINDDLPGFRTSFSTVTTTTSARQHTPQSSISGSPSLTQLCSNDNKVGGGGGGRGFESFSQRDSTEANLHLENNENRSTKDERPSHPLLVSRQNQSSDEKIQLLTPESFSATSRSRMRNIQNLSSTAFEVE